MATEGSPSSSPKPASPMPIYHSSHGATMVQVSLVNHSRTVTGLSTSYENSGESSAKELLKNVKQEDEQDLSPRKKKGKRGQSPAQHIPRHYAKMGILYASSPKCSRRTISTLPMMEGDNLLSLNTLPSDIRHGSPITKRPMSYHQGMNQAKHQNFAARLATPSPIESSLDIASRINETEMRTEENKTPQVNGGNFYPPVASNQKPSPPISLKSGAGSEPGEDTGSSPDSGYGNTPENSNTATAAAVNKSSPRQNQAQIHSSEAPDSPPKPLPPRQAGSERRGFEEQHDGSPRGATVEMHQLRGMFVVGSSSAEDLSAANHGFRKRTSALVSSRVGGSSPDLYLPGTTSKVERHPFVTQPPLGSLPRTGSSPSIYAFPRGRQQEEEGRLSRTPPTPLVSYQFPSPLSTQYSPPEGGASLFASRSTNLRTSSRMSVEGEGDLTGRGARPRTHQMEGSYQETFVPRARKQRSHSQPHIKAAGLKVPPPTSLVPWDEKDYFQVTDELAKENSHFTLSEALLAIIEQYKANCVEQRQEQISTNSATPVDIPNGQRPPSSPSPSLASYRGYHESPYSPMYGDNISPGDDISEYNSPSSSPHVSLLELLQSLEDNSAESTAQNLLQHMARQLTGNHMEDLSLKQMVLQLPTDFLTSLQMDEDLKKSVTTSSAHMRGNKEWAPPRPQIIFHIKTPSRNLQKDLAAQGYRCTGCGMKVDPTHARYFRFCHYTGKYFCQNCHTNATAIIPAHVIDKWSFKRYNVSNFARDLLAKIHSEPVFNIHNVNHHIYSRVSVMAQAKELRRQLVSVKEYLRTCRRAQSLNQTFEDHAPWTTNILAYSMEDFIQLNKSAQKLKQLRFILADAVKHIKSCPLCQGKGFVCEFCTAGDIIYPFEIHRVNTCRVCQCCFHRDCFKDKQCPRCIRVEERQRRRASEELHDDEDPS